jgi:hypothetical protein
MTNPNYKLAYEILERLEVFDLIPEEEREAVDLALKECGL